ncbi:hypothetical protein [Spiroplasma endosymbiont of Virgichneumon dumeticola]|uniref:hypothetical protein n=1 Tax=Spiroplasma endosymbiont of Virgichneumon dumeticola TaxID=3139323 RepID=UPI0035C8E00E
MFSTKNTWEKTYFYQDENLNYPDIKKGLNENILTTIHDLLFFVNTNIKELKSKDSNLEEHCQQIQSILKKIHRKFWKYNF